jgi:hypothetical protein
LTLMFKSRLTGFVSELPPAKVAEMDGALARALDLPTAAPVGSAP